MSRSLADLRASKPQSRPERSLTLCLAPHLVAEVQILTEELSSLRPAPLDTDGDRPGRPRRLGQGEDPRTVEIRERLDVLLTEMAEHEGEMRLRANRTDGEWRRWVNEHPARPDGEPGAERDERVAAGCCNADDLLDDLATYAYAWNGEHLAGDDFAEIFEPNIASADKAQMAQTVVSMYESRLDFQRLRSSLSANLQRWSDSSSPAPSGSATGDSTVANPAASNGVTTRTATGSP